MTRDLILNEYYQFINYFIQIMKCKSSTLSLQRNTSWALSNLCRGTPVPSYEIIKDAIFLLAKLIEENRIK